MRILSLMFLQLITTFSVSHAAHMCPFCTVPTLVMAEQIEMCDHMVLGKWVGGDKSTNLRAGSSKYEITKVGFSKEERYKKGQVIELPQYLAGSEAGSYVLMGPDSRLEDWHSPMEVSSDAWNYMSKMPVPATDPKAQAERLLYFLPYFEHPDQMVSDDAFAEFAAAPYDIIVPLKDRLPREKIMTWLANPKTAVTRIGFYGLLAGLCGKPEDAAVLEKKIVVLDADFRLGIDGVMAGYLLIRGEDGLKVLEDAKMRTKVAMNSDGKEVPLPFSEVYAVMQAVRFMWTYEPNRLPKERLKQSMHILLDRPELADLVIRDLARWKDWSIQDRLMAMYDDEKFSFPEIRRATVQFLFYCSQEKEGPSGDGAVVLSEDALKAQANLKNLEQKDPRTVGDAKRNL